MVWDYFSNLSVCARAFVCACTGGHFDKWLVYGAVTLWMSMGKYFPTNVSVSVCVCVWMCLCAERGTMLWSSDCKPVVLHMINQTDWMGQIWFVIALKGRESEEEMDYSVVCDICEVCGYVHMCEGAEMCIKQAEVKLMYA